MGYVTDDGLHEGWDSAEFPDGRFSMGFGSGGTFVRRMGPTRDPDGGREVVDGRAAIGWRGLCECGWRGPLWAKVTAPDDEDRAAHKVYDPEPSEYADAPRWLEEAIHQEWRGHLPPQSLTDVRAAAEAVSRAQAELNDAVRRARGDGSSWAAIGEAAGITRQSAYERWADSTRGVAAASALTAPADLGAYEDLVTELKS